MPIIYKAKCKVCDTIKLDSGLIERIFQSSFYIPGSPLTLKEIWREQGAEEAPFAYLSLTKHVKKHQYMTHTELEREKLSTMVHKAQTNAIKHTLENITHGSVRRTVMEKGMEALESGDMKISAKDMLSAASKEADIEEKAKDRNAEMQKMIFAYASGALTSAPVGSPIEAGSASGFIESTT